MKNPAAPYTDFRFSVGKMGKSGALFDVAKLNDIAKTYFAGKDEKETFDFLKEWAEEFGNEAQKKYFADEEYAKKILCLLMGIGSKKRRKDFACAVQAVASMAYFFDETFAPCDEYRFDKETVKSVIRSFSETYDIADDCSAWFDKVKAVAEKNGFCADMKAYKANPENYKGSVSDVAEILRIAVTRHANTPDLWTIMQILGKERVLKRLAAQA